MRARADRRTGGPVDRLLGAGRRSFGPTDQECGDPSTACPPDRLSARLWLNLRDRTLACAAVFRRIAGMPDYEAYLGHLRQHHPDSPVPSESEFFAIYMESRYGNGPSRCC